MNVATNFSQRLQLIMDYYELNAASLANTLGVQRSNISHLMSGRNKPSLEFALKIVGNFPEVDLYWFSTGIGKFPKENTEFSAPSPIKNTEKEPENIASTPHTTALPIKPSKEIVRIIFFYNDKSFEIFENL